MFCQAAQVMALHVQDREIEINLKAVVLSCSPIVTFPFVANSYWYSGGSSSKPSSTHAHRSHARIPAAAFEKVTCSHVEETRGARCFNNISITHFIFQPWRAEPRCSRRQLLPQRRA